MNGVCTKCGLSKELCVCETLVKEQEKIQVSSVKRRYGKFITLVRGFSKDVDVKKILKDLKTRLACGGTIKNREIELQGNHKNKVKPMLVKIGFNEDQIEVV